MKYDLVDDQVIVSSSGKLNFLDIRLIQEKVKHFDYNNRHFAFYNGDKTLEKGFYEEAYKDDNVVFLVKYSKVPNRKIGNNNVYFTFKERESLFLKRGDVIKDVSSLRDVKRFFKEKDETLESFIRFNPQSNSENFRSYMIRLLEYLKKNQ